MSLPQIAIIGGGPGGLLVAHQLRKRAGAGFEATIFEAGDRLGGKVRTKSFACGTRYEAGVAELYDYSEVGPDPLRELVRELGLATRAVEGKTVVMDGHVLAGEADIRRCLGHKTAEAIREFTARARGLISPQEYYESDWKADNEDRLARMTFEELLATVPDEAARRYIRVSVHSDLATEAHRTNAMYGLQNYLMNEPGYMKLYSVDGGIERLTRELARRADARVELNRRVARVEREGEMYRVRTRGQGKDFEATFDYVVVALPNNWIPAIAWGGSDRRGEKLAVAMRAHHAHYDYPAHYLRVSALFERPFWRERADGHRDGHFDGSYFMLDAFGGCCVYDETSRGGGDAHGTLGWLIAGDAALNMGNLDDAALIERAMDSLPACLAHGRGLLVEAAVHRWAGSVNGLPAGFPAREPDSRHLPEPEDHPELFVVGDYLFDSTINGVCDSADTVAEWIAEELADEAGEPVEGPAGEPVAIASGK